MGFHSMVGFALDAWEGESAELTKVDDVAGMKKSQTPGNIQRHPAVNSW
jgi:hypothetical protein